LTPARLRFLTKKESLSDILFVLEKFHPFALFVSCGLMILIIQKTDANISLYEKITLVIIAGTIYAIAIAFESWRLATEKDKEKTKEQRRATNNQ
jgi:hypothetical protein